MSTRAPRVSCCVRRTDVMSLIHVNFILTTRESLGSEDYVG